MLRKIAIFAAIINLKSDMTTEEKREQVIQNITEMLQHNSFTFEFKVKKKPAGIKVIYEVTQEQMDGIMKQTLRQ